MNVIPLSENHLPTLARWLNGLPGMRGWDAGWIRRKTLADSDHDPAMMLVAEMQGEPVGFVIGTVRWDQGWIKALVVRPGCQRQGVGSELLRIVEDCFFSQGVSQVTFGWAPLSYFAPGVDVCFTVANVFLERHGYGTERMSRFNMDVSLTGRDFDMVGIERQLADNGIIVERARPEDAKAVGQLAETEGFAMWRDESVQAYQNVPVSSFVARRDGKVCGFAIHSVSGPGEFGPMLTMAGLRGQGIGAVLLKNCLTDLQRQGYRRAEIIWVGPISFYAKAVGAHIGRIFWEWKKSLILGDSLRNWNVQESVR
jgi:mycothiol synthase